MTIDPGPRTMTVAEAEQELTESANMLAAILDELLALQSPEQDFAATLLSKRGQELAAGALAPLIYGVRALATLRRLERYPDVR